MKQSIRTLSLTTLALLVSLAITTRANGGDRFSISASLSGNGPVNLQPDQAPPGSLWYNGDFDGIDGLTNEDNTSLGSGQFSHIYDDFIVTDSGGWDVTALFSDNLTDTNIASATWEIRQGMSGGVGGTLLFSGSGTPIVTPTGRSGFGYTEFQVEIDGLSIHLDPGTYWLNVTPVGDLTGRSFDSTTSGTDCVGTPCGNDDMAFLDSNFFGAVFEPVADFGSQFHDFSMGVIGTVTTGGGLTLDSAFSEKGVWDIDLPLTGGGVENRSGGNRSQFAIYFVFNNNLVSIGSATTSCGIVASFGVDPDDAHQAEVDLANATCNASEVTVTVNDLVDDQGNTLASASITFCLLLGDVNGNGVVDQHDVSNVNHHLGQSNDATNFRDDVNNNGIIDAKDLKTVKKAVGTSCP
jgi:hypothetical protein